MAPLKKGSLIGKTDSAYNQIRVGDTLKNKHTGLTGIVNKYGQITGSSGDIRNGGPC